MLKYLSPLYLINVTQIETGHIIKTINMDLDIEIVNP